MNLLELNFYIGISSFAICKAILYIFGERINSNGWVRTKKQKPFLIRNGIFFIFLQVPIVRFLFIVSMLVMIAMTKEEIEYIEKKIGEK